MEIFSSPNVSFLKKVKVFVIPLNVCIFSLIYRRVTKIGLTWGPDLKAIKKGLLIKSRYVYEYKDVVTTETMYFTNKFDDPCTVNDP